MLSVLTIGIFLIVTFLCFMIVYIRRSVNVIQLQEAGKRAILLEHQKALLEVAIDMQEKERLRIAANLHDDLITRLHRLKLMNNDKKITPLLLESMRIARQISHDLSPPMLEQYLIKELITDYIYPFYEKYAIQFHVNDTFLEAIDESRKLQLFRIFQEVITNIDKHAQATQIQIHWKTNQHYFCLIVKDNGIGLGNNKKGLGLANVKLRSDMIHAVHRIKSTPTGTSFILLGSYDRHAHISHS